MATILDTFVTQFRFKSDRSELKNISKGFDNLKSKLITIGATAVAVFSGGKFFGNLAENLDTLGKLSASLGISVEQLQQLEFAAKRSGVSVSDLEGSLINLNKVVGQSARGYGVYGEILGRFGVSIRDANGNLLNSFQLITELNQRFQKLTTAQQFDLAQNLGITPRTVKLLQQTPEEFNELIRRSKELGLVTAKNTKQAAEFEDALEDVKTSFFVLSTDIGARVLPILTKMIDAFIGFIDTLKKYPAVVKPVLVSIGAVAAAFTAMRIAAVLAWAAAFAPLTAIIAALSGAVLIIQEIFAELRTGRGIFIDLGKSTLLWLARLKPVQTLFMFLDKVVEDIAKVLGRLAGFSRKGINLITSILPRETPQSPSITQNQSPTSIVRSNNISIGGITIAPPSGNVRDISQSIVGELQNQLKNSVQNFDSSVAV